MTLSDKCNSVRTYKSYILFMQGQCSITFVALGISIEGNTVGSIPRSICQSCFRCPNIFIVKQDIPFPVVFINLCHQGFEFNFGPNCVPVSVYVSRCRPSRGIHCLGRTPLGIYIVKLELCVDSKLCINNGISYRKSPIFAMQMRPTLTE